MNDLRSLIETDTELLLKASQASRLLLESTLRAAGMSDLEAADAADEIVQGLEDGLPAESVLPREAAEEIIQEIGDRLAKLFASVANGEALEQQIDALGSTVQFAGGERQLLRRAALALLIYVNVAPDFTVRSDGSWEISKQPVVVAVVSRIMDSVDRAIDAWKQDRPIGRDSGTASAPEEVSGLLRSDATAVTRSEVRPASGLSTADTGPQPASRNAAGAMQSPNEAATFGGPGTTNTNAMLEDDAGAGMAHAQGGAEPPGLPQSGGTDGSFLAAPILTTAPSIQDLTESHRAVRWFSNSQGFSWLEDFRVDLGNDNHGVLGRDEAMTVRNQIFVDLNRHAEALKLSDSEARSLFREHGRRWNRTAPFTFDVGIMPVRHGEAFAYRLAVRVQSPGRFKDAAWKKIYKGLGEALRGIASIRASREVKALSIPPLGGGVRHGTGVRVRDGLNGTITCIAKDRGTNHYLLITAGHVAGRQGRFTSPVGREAYAPPPSDPPYRSIGNVIYASQVTRAWNMFPNTLAGLTPEPDVAAIQVDDATRLAREEFRWREGNNVLARRTRKLTDDDVAQRIPVLKGSGVTAAQLGDLTVMDYAINLTHPDSMRSYCAVGLLEVRLKRPAEPGDSGAPCFDQSGHLLGLVVAGTASASEAPHLTVGSPVIYVQPVHEIFIERGWEIF